MFFGAPFTLFSDNNKDMSQFKIDKNIIISACKDRLLYVVRYRKDFREKQILAAMARKRWFGLKANLTRQQAEASVDALPSDIFDMLKHWETQLDDSEYQAERLIKLCRISEDLWLDKSDARMIERWYQDFLENPEKTNEKS